jgi:hypothetical protein
MFDYARMTLSESQIDKFCQLAAPGTILPNSPSDAGTPYLERSTRLFLRSFSDFCDRKNFGT